MRRTEWRIEEPQSHTVSVEHGFWSGKAVISVDRQEVYRRTGKFWDTGLEHRFDYNRWHSKMTTRVFDSRTLEPVSPTFAHHSQLDYMDGYHKLSPDALRVLVPQGVARDDPRVSWSNAGLHDWPDDMQPQQYDLLTAKPMHPPLDHTLDFYAWGQFAYSPDGALIATSEAGVVKVWDGEAGLLVKEFALSTAESYPRVQFHPDGESLFAIERGRTFWWEIATGELKQEWGHDDNFFISPTGQYAIYTDSGNGSTYVCNIAESDSKEFDLPELYSRVAVIGDYPEPTPDDEYRDVNLLQVWDLTAGRPLFEPIVFNENPSSWIETVQFTMGEGQLAVTEFVDRPDEDESDPFDGTRLHVFDVVSGAPIRPPQDIKHTFRLMEVTDSGEQCLVMREDDRWGVTKKDPVFARGVAQMYSTETWEPLTPMMTPSEQSHARNVTLSPDGRRLVMGSGEIRDATTGKLVSPAAVSHRPIDDFVFQADGRAFITITDGGSGFGDDPSELRFLSSDDATSQSPPMTNTRIGAPYCVLHPETDVLAAAGHGLRLWDVGSGTLLTSAIDLDVENDDSRILNRNRSTFFSADGRRLYIETRNRLFMILWGEIVESVPPDDVLKAWSGILSGHRIDEAGGRIPMTAADYQQAWNTVQETRSTVIEAAR